MFHGISSLWVGVKMNLIAGGNGKAWFSSDSLRLGTFLIELSRFYTVKDVSFDKGGRKRN